MHQRLGHQQQGEFLSETELCRQTVTDNNQNSSQ